MCERPGFIKAKFKDFDVFIFQNVFCRFCFDKSGQRDTIVWEVWWATLEMRVWGWIIWKFSPESHVFDQSLKSYQISCREKQGDSQNLLKIGTFEENPDSSGMFLREFDRIFFNFLCLSSLKNVPEESGFCLRLNLLRRTRILQVYIWENLTACFSYFFCSNLITNFSFFLFIVFQKHTWRIWVLLQVGSFEENPDSSGMFLKEFDRKKYIRREPSSSRLPAHAESAHPAVFPLASEPGGSSLVSKSTGHPLGASKYIFFERRLRRAENPGGNPSDLKLRGQRKHWHPAHSGAGARRGYTKS